MTFSDGPPRKQKLIRVTKLFDHEIEFAIAFSSSEAEHEARQSSAHELCCAERFDVHLKHDTRVFSGECDEGVEASVDDTTEFATEVFRDGRYSNHDIRVLRYRTQGEVKTSVHHQVHL